MVSFGGKIITLLYIKLIKNMFDKVVTSMRMGKGITSKFLITIGLHQGSTLNLCLFVLATDEFTRSIQHKSSDLCFGKWYSFIG